MHKLILFIVNMIIALFFWERLKKLFSKVAIIFNIRPSSNIQSLAYNNTAIDFINYIAYMDSHHKYMFDENNLLYILTQSGFKNVRARSFDSSLDLDVRKFESIYAEAI